MSESQNSNGEILLVSLLPGKLDEVIEMQHIHCTLRDAPSYTACALMIDESYDMSSISLYSLPPELEDMLRSIRHPDSSMCLWVEQLCVDQKSYEDKARHVPILRDIYTAATRVIIWVGNCCETSHDEDLDVYIGPGNSDTTEHAFEFASRFAEATAQEVIEMLDSRYPPRNIHSWAYLFRLLCRPFFRGLPLLRTNYVAQLRNAAIRCSRSDMSLPRLLKAAVRLWAISPIPYFIQGDGNDSDETEQMEPLMETDHQFLLSCMRFGWNPPDIAVRISRSFGGDASNWSASCRFTIHLGRCDDIYDIGNRVHIFHASHERFAAQEADPAGYVSAALERACLEKPPSLPCEEDALLPAPRASDQAPFIHSQKERRDATLLLKLFPASSLNTPIQCGLVESQIRGAQPFSFVTNSTVLRTLFPAEDYCGVAFPVTTRKTVPILVNGQAFVVPRIQEIFLRLVRQAEEPTYLFMWNICMYPPGAMRTREQLRLYTSFKAMLKFESKAQEVDMYSVIEMAGQQRTELDLEYLGLPRGISWDAWLLEIND